MTDLISQTGSREWTHLAVVENGVVVRQDDKPLTGWFTDDGIRPTDEWLASQGYYGLFIDDRPPVSPAEGEARLTPLDMWQVDELNSTVTATWQIYYWNEEEKEEVLRQQWKIVRAERNLRLADSDWTQLADTAQTIGAYYLDYRQALRDIPENTQNPFEVEWPVYPLEGEGAGS